MKFINPSLPLVHELVPYLTHIDNTRMYTNDGTLLRTFERALARRMGGDFIVMNNCTTALMLALATWKTPRRRYAIMPSFTFAATAQAAIWAGFEPYFVDIDTDLFLSEAAVSDALEKIGGQAVVVPVATFGEPFRLDFYNDLIEAGVPVVVDAASAFDAQWLGRPWGSDFNGMMAFSFHATKPFGIGEGGAIRVEEDFEGRLRAMRSFGFQVGREASLLGLNAKMSEYQAAVGLAVNDRWDARREKLLELKRRYVARLGAMYSPAVGGFYPHVFETTDARVEAGDRLDAAKIEYGDYYNPSCHEQAFFADCRRGTMQITEDVADRIICLPMHPSMTTEDVDQVCDVVESV